MRCAIYIRVSLDEQTTQYGLASQLRALQERAGEKGYAIVEVFRDEGFSGADLDRPSLTRLRDLVRSGGVDVVLVHDPDRLSRKLGHQVLLWDELETRKVQLEFITTNSDMTPEGKMFLNMKSIFAEYEREKIRERTLRGRREKAKQGFIVGGIAPYGYRYEGRSAGHRGRFVVDEDQAAIVRQIFSWSLEGISTREIVMRLQSSGVPSKRTSSWGRSSVSKILRNETYIGTAYYNRRQNTEPQNPSIEHRARRNKKTITRMRNSCEWISVDVPPIVSRGVFNAVAVQLRKNAEVLGGKPSRAYLLRGLIWCGLCDSRLYAYPIHGERYYRCGSKDRTVAKKCCTASSVNANKVESKVWAAISDSFRDPGRLLVLIRGRASELIPKTDAGEGPRLQKQLAALQRREFRATQGMLDAELGDYHASFRAQLLEAQKQRRNVEQRLAEVTSDTTPADIEAICLTIANVLPQLRDEDRAAFLRRIVSSIRMYGNIAKVNCVFSNEYCPQRTDGVDSKRPKLGFAFDVKIA